MAIPACSRTARPRELTFAKLFALNYTLLMNPAVQLFRTQYRSSSIPRWYRGYLHLAFVMSFGLAVVVWCLGSLEQLTWVELLVIPFTFLFANFVEHRAHSGPMHYPWRGSLFRTIFERHTLQHHHFFTHDEMSYESSRDFHMVLFPPVFIVAIFGVIAAPVGFLIYTFANRNMGYLYVATAVAYFLNYELFHFLYHCSESSWGGRLPFVKFLRRHHSVHHDLTKMSRWNFNITYPIFDRLLGTHFDHQR